MSHLVADSIAESLRPPSRLPLPNWCEANIRLDHTSDKQGRISLEFYPASRSFLAFAQARRTERVVAVTSAQSAKTICALHLLLWHVVENPTPAIWYSATLESAKEFGRAKLSPALMDCAAAARLAPTDRGDWTGKLIQFATMNLMIRGSESRMDLQGASAGLIICDERREWKPGRIDMARKRLRSFTAAKEISVGTAGIVGDALHRDFLEGSQTFFRFDCLACGHSQPWRFGRNKTPFFPDAREKGGIVFDFEDGRTKSDAGVWDYDAVKRHARYECEKCGHLHSNHDKLRMIKTTKEFHRNPKALPEFPSLHWNAIMMPMESCGFGEIAAEFLSAVDVLKATGDNEPLKDFITETLGEPWEPRVERVEVSDLLARQGDYFIGQAWPEAQDVTFVLSVDRQQHALVFVLRQWKRGGESRMVRCGVFPTIDELRSFQIENKIRNVVGDDGGPSGTVTEWRTACARYGWHTFKGEDVKHFTPKGEHGFSVRSFWKESRADPGIGTGREGRTEIPLFLWSVPHFKEKLYHVFLRGHGPKWEIPKNAPMEYIKQIQANEQREKNGELEWHATGPDHYADAELMNLAFADVAGITRFVPAQS